MRLRFPGGGPAAAALVLALAAPGCSGQAKREVSALAAALDAYRAAPEGPATTQRADDVARTACSDPQVCDARTACVAAITPTLRALALKDEVTRRLGDLQAHRLAPDAPEAQALPAKLDEASRLLQEGRAGMTACEKKVNDLRLHHGV
jgi:hypothetical protein